MMKIAVVNMVFVCGLFYLRLCSEGETIGSASCESYASGQSQVYSHQGESYTQSHASFASTASVSLWSHLHTDIKKMYIT